MKQVKWPATWAGAAVLSLAVCLGVLCGCPPPPADSQFTPTPPEPNPTTTPAESQPTATPDLANTPLALSQVKFWAYQIQDVFVAGMVDRLKATKAGDGVHRKLVIAYIDIGEAGPPFVLDLPGGFG